MPEHRIGNTRLRARKELHRSILFCGIITVVTVITFLPSLKNGFTTWDDNYYVLNNPDIKHFTPHNLAKIFSSSYVKNYQPLTMLTYMTEYHYFQLNPVVYHSTNLLLHITNCLLVFALFYALSGSLGTSLIVGLLFAIHPLRVESVAWIAERKDVLSSFFYFLSLFLYVQFLKNRSWKFYAFCGLALLFSLLSKPMAVSQPLVLLLIDYIRKLKLDKKAVLEKLPFFAISVIFAFIALSTQNVSGTNWDNYSPSILQRICAPFYGTVFYIAKTLVPIHLSAYYPFPAELDIGMTITLLASPFLVIGGAAAVYYFRTYSRNLVFGSLFYVITLLPVLQIVPIGGAIVAERYTYIPMLGIYFVIASLFRYLLKEKNEYGITRKGIIVAGVSIQLLVFCWITFGRCGVWKDSISLWNDVISKYPVEITFRKTADDHRNRTSWCSPPHAVAYNNRGATYSANGNNDYAIEDFTHAIALHPLYTEAYYNRGLAYYSIGEIEKAIKDYTKVIKLNPAYSQVYKNRGAAYRFIKDFDNAVTDFNQAIACNPNDGGAYFNRGLLYLDQAEFKKAIEDFSQAIQLDTMDTIAYCNRGQAYYFKGDFNHSIEDYTRAIGLDPENKEAYYTRGIVYYHKGDYYHAMDDLKMACELGFDQACKDLYNSSEKNQ